jgi:hypothetical protein
MPAGVRVDQVHQRESYAVASRTFHETRIPIEIAVVRLRTIGDLEANKDYR